MGPWRDQQDDAGQDREENGRDERPPGELAGRSHRCPDGDRDERGDGWHEACQPLGWRVGEEERE